MSRQRSFVLLLWAAITLVAGPLSACGPTPEPFECTDAIGCLEIAPGEALKIGALLVLSGPMELNGRSHLQTVELALEPGPVLS